MMAGALHILDEDGNELPAGQAGEIYFEGGVDFEYLNDPDKTASSRDSHGWKTVGDIGYLDEDGYLYLTDRRHHMIISGGVNIYPQEAENILVTHPKVMDAAVFGIPDDDMGQRVKGVVQTVDQADATDAFAQELLSWLRDRLSHYKCPRSISFEAQLPRTDTGKLYKQESDRAILPLAGAPQRHPIGVLLGEEVADGQLDRRSRRRRCTAGRPATSGGPGRSPWPRRPRRRPPTP